jgi:D-3-phosphoglycerate dehydrogenase
MRTLIADKFEKQGIDGLKGLGCEVNLNSEVTAADLPGVFASFDPEVVVVRSKKVQAAAIQAGKSLKLIIRAGAGFDNIDCKAAAAKGVAVCNCPGMNAVAVAELVMGLLVCCDRRIPDQVTELRAGQWNKGAYSKARGLKGMTLGVIGVGGIGREVIRRAKAFDMNCIAHSLNMNPLRAQDLGVKHGGHTRDDLLKMVPECDAISLHVAANAESEKMCDAAFFAAMKPGTYFINTSRGSVVDESALREAIQSKQVRAGLDVFADEPAESKTSWQTPTAALPGVYGTHHCGASTDQAQFAVAEEVVRIVKVFRNTGKIENRVN